MKQLKIILTTAILFGAGLAAASTMCLSQTQALRIIQSVQGAK